MRDAARLRLGYAERVALLRGMHLDLVEELGTEAGYLADIEEELREERLDEAVVGAIQEAEASAEVRERHYAEHLVSEAVRRASGLDA